MIGSPNQYTEKMSVHEGPRSSLWERIDSRLVIEEVQRAEVERWAEHDTPESHVEAAYGHPDTLLAREVIYGRMTIEQALGVSKD